MAIWRLDFERQTNTKIQTCRQQSKGGQFGYALRSRVDFTDDADEDVK